MKRYMMTKIKTILEPIKEQFYIIIPAIASFYLPYIHVIAILLILMICDTFWGIKASRHEGIKFTTNRFSDLFAKMIGYSLIIAIAIFIDLGLKIPYIVWIACFVPIAVEIKSIDESQKRCGKAGIISQAEEAYKFALKIKRKKDKLR